MDYLQTSLDRSTFVQRSAEQTTPQSLAISDTATRQSMEEGKRVLTLAQPACWQQINGGEVAEVVDLNFTDEADVSLD